MSKIHVGFSYPKRFKIGAKAISLWMNRPYSHVYVRLTYPNSKDVIFHAAHGMVHFKSISNFLKENDVVKEYEMDMTEVCSDSFFDQCMELAGEKYSIAELINIFISDVHFYLFRKNIKLYNNRGYICSELVGELCQNKLKIRFNKPLFLLKPSDIDEALASRLNTSLIK